MLLPQLSVKYSINKYIVSARSDKEAELGFLIFLAILLHKSPASIGFGTFLHHEGLTNIDLMKHLFVYFHKDTACNNLLKQYL